MTDSHQVYCALGASVSPVRFKPVAAPRDAHAPGPTAPCDAEACGGPLTDVLELAAAGASHTCALVTGGEVVCWESPGDLPWRLPRFTDPVSIAMSGLGVCAVTRAGGVECLGVDWANRTITEPLAAVPDLTEAVRVAMQGDGLCAITLAGRVDCRMVPARSSSEPLTSDEDDPYEALPPDEWYAEATQPAVAILGWTRDVEELAFAGSWAHFNAATTPLIAVTTDGRLLGMGRNADLERRGPFAFVPGLPCLSVGGRAFCRVHEGQRWGPWEPARPAPEAGAPEPDPNPSYGGLRGPWWLTLPKTVDGLAADLDGVPELLEEIGLTALELVGWDGVPCLRVDDGTVRCVRRMGTRLDFVPVPAARYDRHDLCAAFVDGPDEEPLARVIDLDGSHTTACALLENRDIACWGQLDGLPHGANRKSRRYAPRIIARIHGAVEIAVTSTFVCARVEPSGKVRCLGSAGLGRAPGRWGGFGDFPVDVVGLDGVSRLVSLPAWPLVCAWSRRTPDGATRSGGPSVERKDPQTDPDGALRAALVEGRAVCWGDEDALHNLNATFLGSPQFLTSL
ncbi:MAG TPA: RCC1 domain-containing protein [Myxococcota bacterium]|nr:RCC1 domain-containing protein [Myxococcota bacterium]